MRKNLKVVKLSEAENRYSVKIEGEECPAKTQAARVQQLSLLQTLVSTPGLTDCGPLPFQSLKMYHDGSRWIIDLEAQGL